MILTIAVGSTVFALIPFILLAAIAGALLSAVFGLAGVAIAILFVILAIWLRSLVVVLLAVLLGVLGGLLGAAGVVVALTAAAAWIARVLRNRRSASPVQPPGGRSRERVG